MPKTAPVLRLRCVDKVGYSTETVIGSEVGLPSKSATLQI